MSTDDLRRAYSIARGVIETITPDQYGLATPCASWNGRHLLDHLCEGANWVGLCVEAGQAPDPDPTHGVDDAPGDVLASYDAGAKATLAAFDAAGDNPVELRSGRCRHRSSWGSPQPSTSRMPWDLATAIDVDVEPRPRACGPAARGCQARDR